MGGKARVSSHATRSLLALHVWPKFLGSCISIKTCVGKNPKSFLVKVTKSEKYEKQGFSLAEL
jgi:hypothetical protein